MRQNQTAGADRKPRWPDIVAAFALLLALPAIVAVIAMAPLARQSAIDLSAQASVERPTTPPPPVEPLEIRVIDRAIARAINAAVPFSRAPNPAAQAFKFPGDAVALSRATDCLAAAMIYEAGDDATGERAVGQVVLNRLRHPAFPKTVCGVVFQGEERRTGCQFTFTCDGALARTPSAPGWDRARALAAAMLAGDVYKPVGHATHYHTDWVVPYWSGTLDKVVAVDTHLFFRWQGWWGTPGAFAARLPATAEPIIAKLAFLSAAHRPDGVLPVAAPAVPVSLIDDSKAPMPVGADKLGTKVGPAKLIAIEPGGNGFILALDKASDPASFPQTASLLCAGRIKCVLMAWNDPAATPRSYPPDLESLATMSYSYIRIKESGLERSLYNCSQYPGYPKKQCMVLRQPRAAPPMAAMPPADNAVQAR